MNKIIHITDLWMYKIIPYIRPKLFRCADLRSISKTFCQLFPPCPIKSKYIKVPSDKYKTLEDAYLYIYYCMMNYIKPPEIWLDCGTFYNIDKPIKIPVVIRGMGMDKTIVKNGFNFEIDETLYKMIPNLTNPTLNSISIINDNVHIAKNGRIIKDVCNGVLYNGTKCLYILSCKIKKCNGAGIKGNKIIVNIVNSIICNNNKSGIHIWHDSRITADNLEVHHCKNGISIGNLKTKFDSILNNIYIHHNDQHGLSVGGWDPDSKVIVSGKKTDISFNNFVEKHKYAYGIETSYSGKIIFNDLDKNISHDNYNNQNIEPKRDNQNSNENIIYQCS